MMIDAKQLQMELTRAMADAVDEADSYDDYFGEGADSADYGVARADGVMPADLLFLWNYAGQLVDYMVQHGLDALDLAEQAGNLFMAFQALKSAKSDFDNSEKKKIQKAAEDKLHDLVDKE
nr:hypothetical protein [uncultured Cohaesibacter sp.]